MAENNTNNSNSSSKPIILFDFWGTLAQQGVYSPVKQIKAIIKPNIPFKEYIKRMQNSLLTKNFESMREAFEEVYEEFNIDSTPKKLDDLVGMWNKNWLLATLFDDTKKALEELKQTHKIVLIANSDKASINNVLNKFELTNLFDEIFLSCNLGVIKSDPEFLEKVVELLGTTKENVTVVGDSMQSDIYPAKDQQIKAVLVDRKGNREFTPKVTTLKNLKIALEDN